MRGRICSIGLEDKAFAISWVLKGFGLTDTDEIAVEIQTTLDSYPGWPYNQKQEGEVRLALYRLLKDQVVGSRQSRIGETRAEYKVAGQPSKSLYIWRFIGSPRLSYLRQLAAFGSGLGSRL